jgi:hypothetical protein
MDKKQKKVLVYVNDLIYYEATLSSEQILVDTQQAFKDLVVYLAKSYPEIMTQWNAVVKDVHKLLRLFTSKAFEKQN